MRKLLNNELKRLTIEEFKTASKIPLVIVLDDVRSLNNIGSVFRTADAFLVEEIHLCGITAVPPHREIQKTALGATESVAWQYFDNIQQSISQLKIEGYNIYAIEQVDVSIPLNNFSPDHTEKIAIILGNEINGVNDVILPQIHGCIEIPQFGTKHSLNISVCAGIVIWHFFSHMRK